MSGAAAATANRAPPLHGFTLVLTAALIALASFMVTLDGTICNVSIPTIASGLGVSPHEGTWVVTSYAVADAITVLLAGWLSARFGPGHTAVFCVIGFGLASIACGLSTSLAMLVTARIVQGLMGGPLIPLSQAMMLSIFPKEKAGAAMVIWALTNTAGPVFGSLLGGYICDNWSWPWVFLINTPFAVIMATMLWRLMKPRDQPTQRRPVDFVGFGLMIVWIGALQMMLDRGLDMDWFDSSLIVALLIVAIIGFLSFLIWELTETNPIVNLRVFANRGFSTGVVVISLGFSVFFGSTLLSPLWLQTSMGYTPTWAGFTAAMTGLTGVTLSPFVAWITGRVDLRVIIFFGMMIMATAYVWRGHFATDADIHLVILTQISVGIGVNFFFAPAMALTLGSVRADEVAGAAGMISFVRTASMAFATAITTTIWQDGMARNRVGIVDRLTGAGADHVATTGLSSAQALAHLDRLVQDQAVMLATNDAYYRFAIVVGLGALGLFLAPRPRAKPHT